MIAKSAAIGLGLALLLGFLGRWHGIGDSFAVFRVGFAILLLVAALRLRGLWRWPFAGLAAIGLISFLWYKVPQDKVGPFSLYQKNMKFQNSDLDGLADDVLVAAPDIVTLQEVSVTNEHVLRRLQVAYPYQHLCRSNPSSGSAVLSRHPLVGDRFCGRGMGMAAAQVQLGDARVWAVAVHLTWPYPKPQHWQVERMGRYLTELGGPFVIGGDFNAVPWSYTVARVAALSQTRRAGPSGPSFLLGSIPITIDQVFAPGGGQIEMRGFHGSDHRGLLARVNLGGTL